MDRTLPPGCSGAWVTPLAQGVGHACDSSRRRPYVFCVKAVSHTHTALPHYKKTTAWDIIASPAKSVPS